MKYTISIIALCLFSVSALAQDKTLAPFVNDYTYAVVHIDAARLDRAALQGHFEKVLDKQAPPKEFWEKLFNDIAKAKVKDVYLVLGSTVENPMDVLVVMPLAKDADPKVTGEFVNDAFRMVLNQPAGEILVKNGTLLASLGKIGDRMKDFQPKANVELDKALATVAEDPIRVAFAPPDVLRRVFTEIAPTLPKELGGGPSTVLTKGVQWAALGIDLSAKIRFRAIVQSQDEPSAKDLEQLAGKAVEMAKIEAGQGHPDLVAVFPRLMPKLEGKRLELSVDEKLLHDFLVPAVVQMRANAERTTSMSNFKQLAISMHAHHDAHGTLPPAYSVDAQGKPLLSWRVHVLPYLDQLALYKQFHLDEPWDSPNNKKLLPLMPTVFRPPLMKNVEPGKTTYLVPTGPETIFDGAKGMKLTEIKDGTSNTIMIVEANDSKAVYWTQPEDYPADKKNPAAGLIRQDLNGFIAAFADGSVRILPASMSAQDFWGLFTANGRESIRLP